MNGNRGRAGSAQPRQAILLGHVHQLAPARLPPAAESALAACGLQGRFCRGRSAKINLLLPHLPPCFIGVFHLLWLLAWRWLWGLAISLAAARMPLAARKTRRRWLIRLSPARCMIR
jgi:hypothetical protein